MTQTPTTKKKSISSKDKILACAKAAIDKKATNSVIFEVGKLGAFTDYFLITSGTNERQVQAICDAVSRACIEAGSRKPSVEGYDEGRWALVDFGDVVVHVFHDYIREFYNLEELWGTAPKLAIPKEYYTGETEEVATPASSNLVS